MTAPGPVAGVNPYTLAYQKLNYDAGIPANGKSVLNALAFPEATATAAALVTPAIERANNIASPQAGIAEGY